jgi:hypothetical protein
MASIEWGPVATWAGAIATFVTAAVAVLVAMGRFDWFRAPRIRITFGDTAPWCRTGERDGGRVLWVRVGVENVGRRPAHGCVGRLIGLSTDGEQRTDVDPVQLRWAGLPRSRAFDDVDVRRDQREFINVLLVHEGGPGRIVTFEGDDFDPGFPLDLDAGHEHVLQVSVFSDDAETASASLVVDASAEDGRLRMRLLGR